MRRVGIILVALLLTLFISGIAQARTIVLNNDLNCVKANEHYCTFETVNPGDLIKISPSPGFEWRSISDKRVLRMIGRTGPSSQPVWLFKVLRPGKADVKFEYKASRNDKPPQFRTFVAELESIDVALPTRVKNTSFPGRAAFVHNGYLWMIDGNKPQAQPVQITKEGWAEIRGWSPDGQWLAYQVSLDRWGDKNRYLWVIRANATNAVQIDSRPINNKPVWSPKTNVIAYSTRSPQADFSPDNNLKQAYWSDGVWKTSTILPDQKRTIADMAWYPNGQALVISLVQTLSDPLDIKKLSLDGKLSSVYTRLDSRKAEEGIYVWSVTGLTFSPDGRYLAFFLPVNSASISADGVSLAVLDTVKGGNPFEIGGSLEYPEWLAWSPDSTQLAFINGGGREATCRKWLSITNMDAEPLTTDINPAGMVETQPLWTPTGLFVCQGPDNNKWEGNIEITRLLVPGQRIFLYDGKGHLENVTAGTRDTADYFPMLSSDDQYLAFVRMTRYDRGNLYVSPFPAGKAYPVVTNIFGKPGYYGNYYPEWVSIYWNTVTPGHQTV